jgi:hypothetical protein
MSYRVIGVTILLSLILFCNDFIAQNDSKMQQWLKKNMRNCRLSRGDHYGFH